MRKVIISLLLIILTVFLSGCLDTQLAQIDHLSEIINVYIESGDDNFNNAATNTNKYRYFEAEKQCNNATTQYNLAKTSVQEALIYSRNIQDEVYISYMEITLQELDAKINATNELRVAIPLFMGNDTESGNKHVDLANQHMQTSLDFKRQKQEIVKQFPTKFKK